MPHRGFTVVILLAIIAILVAGGIVGYIAQGNKTGPTASSRTETTTSNQAQATGAGIDETTYGFDGAGSAQLRYWNSDGTSGGVLYTFPPALWEQFQVQSGAGALPEMGDAVPVPSKPNEYYFSVTTIHADGRIACGVISNRIYVLDTIANTVSLYYEEFSSALSQDDYRACDKQVYLVGTEGNKLILEYHPIGRGGVCDRVWAYPESIWYLDIIEPSETRKFSVPDTKYQKALSDVAACQKNMGV